MALNQAQKLQKDDRHKAMLETGYDYLFELAEKNRLFVRDASEIRDMDDLEQEIKRRLNRKLFVVIDGLYNLYVGDERGEARKKNVKRAFQLKSIIDT